jgi:hypothetical protein
VDTATLLIVGGLALAIVVAALFALRRAWGNFPDRAGTLPPAGASAPGMSRRAAPRSYSLERELAPPEQAAAAAGEPPTGLVPIEHPMVRRAAEAALQKDSSAARYIVRDGDQLYFSFAQISDPLQRQAAYDLMRRFNAGEDVDIRAMMRLTQEMFRKT